MSLDIDTLRFLESTTLPTKTVEEIQAYHEVLKNIKGIFSINDTLGKAIASGYFGDLASAHFRRWILANYEIGDEED